MKLTQPQQVICEHLLNEPMTIADIVTASRFSASYVRAQVKLLEQFGRIEKVDNRQPYIYQLTKDNPYVLMHDKLTKYKALLLDNSIPTENSFVGLLRQVPKEEWPIIADELRAITEVIDSLEMEGKLIETVEGIVQ